MTVRKKGIIILPVLLLLAISTTSCRPRNNQNDHYKNAFRDIVNNEKLLDAVAERIKAGATAKDFLPPAGVMVTAIMVPITGSIGFFLVLFVFIRLHHKRAMAMIDKGSYKPGTLNIRWDLIVVFIGIICLFAGPGISIVTVGMFGASMWSVTSGLIPVLIGSAFLVFYNMFLKKE